MQRRRALRRAGSSIFRVPCSVVVFALTALAPALLVAQPARRPLAIEDYYRIRSVSQPRMSPDGRWVLYTVGTRVEENNGNIVETWYVPADGSASPRRITHDGRDAAFATWVGGQIRFRAGEGTWLLDPVRGEPVPERSTAAGTAGIADPHGDWIAHLVRQPPRDSTPTDVSDFERRHEDRFQGARFDWLEYKRDGATAPVRNLRDPVINPPLDIFVTDAAAARSRRLTRLGLQPDHLQWTRSGRAILFRADPLYRDELSYPRSDLWLVTLDKEVRRLTRDGFLYTSPTLSPDRRLLAYVRSLGTDSIVRARLDHGGAYDLFMVRAPDVGTDEWQPLNLTASFDHDPGPPVWSPDNQTIYFGASVGGESHLFRVAVRGGPVQQVTSGRRRITSISFDQQLRTMAYTAAADDHLGEVYVAHGDGSNERRLTNESESLLRAVELSPVERVDYQSRDGTRIEGWLILPYGYRNDGTRYPLIVSNHGGPHSATGHGFEFKNQYLAANGYFVLEVNFRGSIGYGDAFKWATWGAWGTKDGEDVIAGIDHVLARYPIDTSRVGVSGHSYGGFLTNWLITQYPERFAAAVSAAGISNWISDYGLADIGRSKETEFFGAPWQPRARDIMIRQSPLFYADRVRTPTLFVHGAVDYRVPFQETEQFYFALKRNGVPARVIMYEGQAHGIAGHWNNVHRIINELGWWNTWLQPKPHGTDRRRAGDRGRSR